MNAPPTAEQLNRARLELGRDLRRADREQQKFCRVYAEALRIVLHGSVALLAENRTLRAAAAVAHLDNLAASGGHGVNLADMNPDERRHRLFGEPAASGAEIHRTETQSSSVHDGSTVEDGDAQGPSA